MKLDRKKAIVKHMNENDTGYVDASPAERVVMMWELTIELWSLRNKQVAEQRLQRDVAKLIRMKSED